MRATYADTHDHEPREIVSCALIRLGCIITRMKKHLVVAACLAAAVHLAAQQRAPQNESIRQEDLRADLFFLAGDSMRGPADRHRGEPRRRPTSSDRGSSAWG